MSYRITNRATGSIFQVEDDETVLGAARRQGVNLCYSCLTGNCTACGSSRAASENVREWSRKSLQT